MTNPQPHRLSRRHLLLSAASGLAAATIARRGPATAAARQGQAVKVLAHDAVQDGDDFDHGRHAGTFVGAGELQGQGTFESSVVASPFAFTHAGLHWRGTGIGLAALAFEVRTSEDGAVWTEWQRLQIEAGPSETPPGDTFGALVAAPRHRFLQYRATLNGAASVATVTATFLNSADGPTIAITAALTPVKPPVIDMSREDWGCDESLRFSGGTEIWPRMFVPVKKLVVHHTASTNGIDPIQDIRSIYTYHARTLGWGDIGYNALIDRNGVSYEGRYGREFATTREVFSADVVAGHASGHNYGTCGVAGMGNFEQIAPTTAMTNRMLDVLAYQAADREIDPSIISDFLQSGGSWTRSLRNVCGHRDCNATACPGQYLYQQMPAIRNALASRLGLAAGPGLDGPDGTTVRRGSLSYTWTLESGYKYSYYLEGWSKPNNSENISYLSGYDSDHYPVWSPSSESASSAQFSGLANGHYTFHLRRVDSLGKASYQANKTVLVQGGGSGKPKR